jgi:hypothetical protein
LVRAPCFSRLESAVKPKIGLLRCCKSFWAAAASTFLLGSGPCSKPAPALVGDCDAYVKRYEECLQKLSAEERGTRAAEGEAMRKVLHDEAERPESKDKVAGLCRAALASLADCP